MKDQEESKNLLEKEDDVQESSINRSKSITPNRDLTPDKLRRNKTGITLFKKDASGEKLTKEMAFGLNFKVLIEK